VQRLELLVGHRRGGGHDRLGQELAAEDHLALGQAPRPEATRFDLVEIEDGEQVGEFGHGAENATAPMSASTADRSRNLVLAVGARADLVDQTPIEGRTRPVSHPAGQARLGRLI
jgi:hypothetical protein